ncbi:PBP1A family penicillin-binding protein [Apilactobacillus ozensis]|uniref:PBP1A family penicillin-binding protein n=1 Tax=Apilactobacillus ozensis TaxID=866801 RepID=UPI003D30F4FD
MSKNISIDTSDGSSSNSRVNKNKNKYKKGRFPVKKTILGILAFISLMIILGTGLFAYFASTSPQITYQSLSSDNSTKIYDDKKHVISRLGAQNRDYVKNNKIPTQLKQAVTSIEDRRFYKHKGVDPIGILGAAASNVTGSSLGLQGGSTLTQQLVKLSVFSTAYSDRTLKRKSQEAWLALKVERTYSKDKILEFYINKVYMGNNVYGMQTAAEYYYGKPLSKLSLPELALLAGMPQSPSGYNPYLYPEYATQRRNQVLNAMVRTKAISSEQAQQAKSVSVKKGLTKTHKKTELSTVKQKYIDSYLKQVIQELKSKGLKTNSGLKVYTNLDLSAQKHLYKLANNSPEVGFPNNRMQIGATLVDSQTGKVKAMLGSRKNNKVAFGLNRAVQTDRSSGSTMKPLMDYGPAIEYLKYPTYQLVNDTPYTYPGTSTSLKDFDYKYQGTITMHKALIESRNIPAIRTLQNVGINKATEFLSNLGITFNDTPNLQNGIGAYISSEQEAAAYAAFANGGTYHKPYLINKITFPDGKSTNYETKPVTAMSPETAFMITSMLKGVMNNQMGSGTEAKVPGLYEAGKTGSTQYPDNSYKGVLPGYAAMDSWFTGYTKNYSLSIWTGYDRPVEVGNYLSANDLSIAQKIYKYEMQYISQNLSNEDWVKPANLTQVSNNGLTDYYINGYSAIQPDKTSGGFSSSAIYNNQPSTSSGNQSSYASSAESNNQRNSSSSAPSQESSSDKHESANSSSQESSESSANSSSSSVSNTSSSSIQSNNSSESSSNSSN